MPIKFTHLHFLNNSLLTHYNKMLIHKDEMQKKSTKCTFQK